jgi:hypothetical protein
VRGQLFSKSNAGREKLNEQNAMKNKSISYEENGRFAMIPHPFIERAKELSLHARWLFVTLMYFRNTKSGLSFPSYKTIRELTGLRRQMISSSIKELEKEGWLTRKKRYGNSTLYTLILPRRLKVQAGVRSGVENA